MASMHQAVSNTVYFLCGGDFGSGLLDILGPPNDGFTSPENKHVVKYQSEANVAGEYATHSPAFTGHLKVGSPTIFGISQTCCFTRESMGKWDLDGFGNTIAHFRTTHVICARNPY